MAKTNENERNRVSRSLSWDPVDLEDALLFLKRKRNGMGLSEWIRELVTEALREWRATHKPRVPEEIAGFLVGIALVKGGIEKIDFTAIAAEFKNTSAHDFLEGCELAKKWWEDKFSPRSDSEQSQSPGIRISPTPAGDQDMSVLDEKPSLDVPDDDGEEDGGEDQGRKKA